VEAAAASSASEERILGDVMPAKPNPHAHIDVAEPTKAVLWATVELGERRKRVTLERASKHSATNTSFGKCALQQVIGFCGGLAAASTTAEGPGRALVERDKFWSAQTSWRACGARCKK
jgi:hypothetical protein